MKRKDDNDACSDRKCPVKPVVGRHTRGIRTSGPKASDNKQCSKSSKK